MSYSSDLIVHKIQILMIIKSLTYNVTRVQQNHLNMQYSYGKAMKHKIADTWIWIYFYLCLSHFTVGIWKYGYTYFNKVSNESC